MKVRRLSLLIMMRTPLSCCPADLCRMRSLYSHTELTCLASLSTGYLYTSFASLADYEYVLKHGRELGVILWESAAKRCFFTSVEGHASIRLFIERSGQTQQGNRS